MALHSTNHLCGVLASLRLSESHPKALGFQAVQYVNIVKHVDI